MEFRKAMSDLPPLLDMTDERWTQRGNPAEVASLRRRLDALQVEVEEAMAAVKAAKSAVKETLLAAGGKE
jgi:hypothetical protein